MEAVKGKLDEDDRIIHLIQSLKYYEEPYHFALVSSASKTTHQQKWKDKINNNNGKTRLTIIPLV